jgi:hypothetical protein
MRSQELHHKQAISITRGVNDSMPPLGNVWAKNSFSFFDETNFRV